MPKNELTPEATFTGLLLQNHPDAIAWITGDTPDSTLNGSVKFYNNAYSGILVKAQIFGLPNIDVPGATNFYAMHIHESGDCSDHFNHTGVHYNPGNTAHPDHAGDMPPLLGNQGYAFSVFYDKRFTLPDIIGRSVIIHEKPDDFTSQPAGNAGNKIGCGRIERFV